jgi:hypothetical protein
MRDASRQWERTMARVAWSGLVLLAVVLVGCSGATPTAAPGSSEAPTPAVSASAPATSTATSTLGPTTPAASAKPTAAALAPRSVAVTVATSVVVRSKPEISTASEIFKPPLSAGDQVYVSSGPVRASGYDWYQVQPLTAHAPSWGWVVAASRSGEPWLVPGVATCPLTPTTFAQLTTLTYGQRLACFSRVPITVAARLLPCNCSVDALPVTPAWFLGGTLVLADPSAKTPVDESRLGRGGPIELTLDPTGNYPEPLPVGDVMEVTGVFDHPAASGCTQAGWDLKPAPSDVCRYQFAVTTMK